MTDAGLLEAASKNLISEFEEWTRSKSQINTFLKLVDAVIDTLQKKRKLIFFGNGGSAAEASHLAGEFIGKCEQDVGAQPAISLTDSGVLLTAISNDWSYEEVFCRQLKALAQPGDMAIGLSTSGTSKSVLSALQLGKTLELQTSLWTSTRYTDGLGVIDYLIKVPSLRTPRAQEIHLFIGHTLCEYVESAFNPGKQRL